VNMVAKRVEVEIERMVGKRKAWVFIILIFLKETGSLHVIRLKPIILFLQIDCFLDIIILACRPALQQ
jgi:hypothetical protein